MLLLPFPSPPPHKRPSASRSNDWLQWLHTTVGAIISCLFLIAWQMMQDWALNSQPCAWASLTSFLSLSAVAASSGFIFICLTHLTDGEIIRKTWLEFLFWLFFLYPSISRGLILPRPVLLCYCWTTQRHFWLKTRWDLLCHKIPANTTSAASLSTSCQRNIKDAFKKRWGLLNILKSLSIFSHFSFHTKQVWLCHVIMQIMLSGPKCVIAGSPNGPICVFAVLFLSSSLKPWKPEIKMKLKKDHQMWAAWRAEGGLDY